MMVVSPESVVKLLQACFSVLWRRVTWHKCNIAWVLSLCNTSSLNMETTDFEIPLLMVLYLTKNWCISFGKSKKNYVVGLWYFLLPF